MSNDKTLATAKHGGCVQLKDGQHVLVLREMRAQFTDAGSPARTAALDAAIAALSAPPSPGGQGDANSPLSVYADSYRRMAKMGDGRVSCIDVAFDIEHNMARALAAQLSPGGKGDVPFCAPHCQNSGSDICLAAQRDGVICPNDSCDIDDGIRHNHVAARQPVGEPVPVEIPQGAIINGAAFADRLEHDYQFECAGGPLVNCTDYVEFRRCFDFLAQWASSLPPLYAAPTAQSLELARAKVKIAALELQLAVCEQPAQAVDDDWHLRGYAYASKQATTCAGCGEHKHTPLRIDAMGGYVCLTCIDQKLGSLLGEFGYPPAQAVDLGEMRKFADEAVEFINHGYGGHARRKIQELLALIDSQAVQS